MLVTFEKYHALRNDFLVVELNRPISSKAKLARLTRAICDRRTGAGADGVLFLSRSRKADHKVTVCNADGSWAEKSGNGLRIAAVHVYSTGRAKKKRSFAFETASSIDIVSIGRKIRRGYMVTAELERPRFETNLVPVKTRRRFMINAPLTIGGVKIPVTCLSVGNPHTVLIVNDFDFDWQVLGEEIEWHRAFPNRTNVEFVKIVSRKKVKVADWERGAGATGSSGTGAAASVCAGVIMGLLERECEVVFDTGSLYVKWPEDLGVIKLGGPVEHVCTGKFEL
jgi:diaminopimelate epimerase